MQEIIKNVSKYLEIYEEKENTTTKLETFEVGSYLNKDKTSIISKLNSYGVEAVVLGDGDTIVEQYPQKGSIIDKTDKVFLLTNGTNILMPNIIGYSAKDFYSLMFLMDIPYETNGIGYVVSQSIPANTIIDDKMTLKVEFSSIY